MRGIEWAENMDLSQLVLSFRLPERSQFIHNVRRLASELKEKGKKYPIHLSPPLEPNASAEDRKIDASIALGSLLSDGIGDSIQIEPQTSAEEDLDLLYNILQMSGMRITKTEFISCPSCGRTLFDLKSTTEEIRSRMSHLVGVKIAIMGCIVNGPGEMADADFGYVGGAPGKINLYVGKRVRPEKYPCRNCSRKTDRSHPAAWKMERAAVFSLNH